MLRWIRLNPVRAFAAASQLIPVATAGLVIFDAWHPTSDQLAYVNGLPAAVAVAVGFSVARHVTPNNQLPPPPPAQ